MKTKWGGKLNYKFGKNANQFIIIIFILLLFISIILNNDLILKFNFAIILLLICFILLKNNKFLLIITLFSSILSQFLVDEFNLPQVVQYIPDILALFILLKIINQVLKTKKQINNSILKYIIALLFCQIVALILNDYSLLIFIWGCRNLYRFFIVFVGFQYLYTNMDYSKLIKYLKVFVIFQLFVILFQSLRYSDWDYISGFFGHSGTGLMLVYLMFIFCFFLSSYFHKKMNGYSLLLFLLIIFIPLILGSVKAAFFYIPTIIFIMFVFSPVIKKNYKTKIRNVIIISIFIPLFTLMSVTLFLKVFSSNSEFSQISQLYSLKYISSTVASGSYNGDGNSINRLNGVSIINSLILDNAQKKIFGVGIGNASPNKHTILQGNYFKIFSRLNYFWFFIPYFVLENGFLGTSIFFIIMISLFIKCSKIYKKTEIVEEKIFLFAYQGCVISVFLTLIYNSSFNSTQVGYFFWALSGLLINLENKYIKN